MSTDAEKVGAMVSAMHSALENNKELHREITALKAEKVELEKLLADHKECRSISITLGECINRQDSKIESLQEKLALAVENLRSIKAEALKNGIGERHRCEHIASIVNETLAKIQGEKMEGKE